MPEYQPQQKQKQTMIKPKPEYHAKAFEKADDYDKQSQEQRHGQ